MKTHVDVYLGTQRILDRFLYEVTMVNLPLK